MSGFAAAIGPVLSAISPALGPLSTILSSVMAPKPPEQSSAPAAPEVAPAPPPPTESSADDVSSGTPAVDAEAARVRAGKRRKASESKKLFSLGAEEDESVTLTKTLLGG